MEIQTVCDVWDDDFLLVLLSEMILSYSVYVCGGGGGGGGIYVYMLVRVIEFVMSDTTSSS